MADVARPLRAVFLRDDESEVESNGGYGETPTRLCLCETARQPARGPDLVLSSYQVECGSAAVLRRWVPHGGDLLVRCGLLL